MVALCIIVIGVQMAFKSENIMVVIFSIVLGAIVGEGIDIDTKLQRFGDWIGSKLIGGHDAGAAKVIGEGFVAASLIYCVGAMAIIGSLQDGLKGDTTILFAKSTLDGIIAIILTANLGIGVALSAVSVLLYQGTLTLLAGVLEPVLTTSILNEVTATGGMLIMAIGVNMLKVVQIRISNLLPAVLWAGDHRCSFRSFIKGEGRTMEQINQILGNNLLFIIAVLLVLIVFLLVMLVNMNSKLRKLQWKYDYFTKGTTMDLDEVLTQTLEDVRSAEAKITALEKSRDDLRLRLKSCVQNLRVLRYNAFDNTGSDLSYSVALVDEENNGVVLSSIYGREENRCYAKPVIAGKSQYVLSKEEQEVLQQK